MITEGYSKTPLSKKLGIKEGFVIRLFNQPDYYFSLFDDLPLHVEYTSEPGRKKDLIHFFTDDIDELKRNIKELHREINSNGSIWVSWPKKSAGLKCNLSENDIRQLALANGLVDVKVCAIDKLWSGLKLVIPLRDR